MGNFFAKLSFQFREAISGVRRTGAMNVATVTTVALSLFILGSFLLFLRNLNLQLDSLKTQYQIVLYLAPDMKRGDVELLLERLQNDEAVKKVRFVSKEEALETMAKELGREGSFLPDLTTNPIPDSIEVHIVASADFDAFRKRVTALPGVTDGKAGQEWVGRLLSMVDLTRMVGLIMVLVLGTASLLIIANTIKLTVYARREEIAIMKIVGATNWFIRTPFLIEGCLQGFVGAAVSLLVLLSSYHVLAERIVEIAPFLTLVSDVGVLTKLSSQILLMGMLLGLLGSLISLRRIAV